MTTYDPSLPYASPAPRAAARGWAGAAIPCGGLMLIVLGGCFLIGVLVTVTPGGLNGNNAGSSMTGPELGLMWIRYLLAFACFSGAAALLAVGTRALLQVMRA